MRNLPHSADAELKLIATLFRFNETWSEVRHVVEPKDFHIGWHDVIFEHIGKVLENGERADLASVDASIERDCGFGADFYRYLHGQFSETTHPDLSADNALSYAKIVRDKAIRRSLIDACENIVEWVQHPEYRDTESILDNAGAMVFSIAKRYREKTHQRLDEVIEAAMQRIGDRSRESAATESSGLSTGFAELDSCIHGLQGGDLVLLAGHPGMGKRALAMKIVEHLSIDAGHPVLIFSLERSAKQLGEAFLASRAGIPYGRIRRGHLSEKDRAALEVAAEELRKATVVIFDDARTISIVELRAQMRRTYRECKHLGLIVIDSLQKFAETNWADDTTTGLDSVLRELKRMAEEELSVPILVLSDLSRTLEARDDKRPRTMDIRKDGINDQWADVVLALYRDDRYNPDSNDRGVTEIHVLKNCDGAEGVVRLEIR